MSTESDGEFETTAEPDVDALARQLGDAITELPEYETFEEARAAVETDPDVQEKISEFERLRQEFALARQTGRADEAAVEEVRQAQQELHAMPTMATYLDAQEALQRRLETLNELISDPLSVDFGGEAGGCCQDD
jgi:cell fate (sporulation/competence/biofilm development) regulator YlbF (YheA/YmcA/DUF963 family)